MAVAVDGIRIRGNTPIFKIPDGTRKTGHDGEIETASGFAGSHIQNEIVEGMCSRFGAALILVHGPAGFGKTTVISQYHSRLQGSGIAVSWLTLDRADNDIIRFISCFVEAFKNIDPDTPSMLDRDSSAPSDGSDAASALLTRLASCRREFALIVDDFEVIENPAVMGLMRQIIDQLPAARQLVIGSRAVPDLGVGRLRAHGRLVEVGPAQLRFSLAETASFLRHQRVAALRAEDLQCLQQRTEGWPAALGLASLALRECDDACAFIVSFGGRNTAITDYIAEDVLPGQDELIRCFLLRTSILQELNAPLCDYLLERNDSADLLTQIEQAHLFLVAQGGDRKGYRYHPIFSDFLRNQLRQSNPRAIAALHRRAAQWWAGQGQPARAIEHALQSDDEGYLLSLLKNYTGDFLWRGRAMTLTRWYAALPATVQLTNDPALALEFAWALTLTHRYGESLKLLDAVQAAPALADADGGNAFAVEARAQRAFIFAMTDRITESLALWQTCAPLISAARPFVHTMLGASMGYCLVARNRFDQARNLLAAARQRALETGDSFIDPMTLCLDGAIDFAQGRLRDATASFRAALAGGNPAMLLHAASSAVAAAFLAEALYEAHHLDEAQRLLTRYLPLLKEAAAPDQLITSFTLLARIALARGHAAQAGEVLDEMEVAGHRYALPRMVVSARLERSRIALLDGRLEVARSYLASASEDRIWAPFAGLITHANDVDAPFIAELRWRVHGGQAQSAIEPLKRAISGAGKLLRRRRALKLSILLAHALCSVGQTPAGLRRMRDALEFAAQKGFARSFIDEGSALLPWIAQVRDALVQAPGPDAALLVFADRLLCAGDDREAAGSIPQAARKTAAEAAEAAVAAPALSRREAQVIRLLAAGHRNREIARRLFVSETTVKAHLRSINVKLCAKSRTHAVAIARQMGLLA